MDNFNLGHIISKFSTNRVQNNLTSQVKPQSTQSFMPAEQAPSAANTTNLSSEAPKMGNLVGSDTSNYVKDLMNLPKNMNEFVYMIQRNINQAQFNQMYQAAQRNALSQQQAQILAQLQGLSTTELQNILKGQLSNQVVNNLKNLQISSSTFLNLSEIAMLLQTNGKDAITKLILTMANASKQGVTDLTQLKDTAKLINASIALASKDNPNQTLKSLMMLYLPWLPLNEGSDFDIEIQQGAKDNDEDGIIVVTITTVNYGVVKATIILETANSVHVDISCDEKFPKDELLLRIQTEEKHYSMQSVISFETTKSNPDLPENSKAKVDMSSNYQVNPYLLLMAHSIIRNTIELDNQG